jgi:hypothetical protein
MDSQAELFPYASPETVLAYCRRIEQKVLEVAPELTARECNRILAELTLTTLVVDKISLQIRSGMEWLRRQSLPQVIPIESARGERIVQPPAPPDPPRPRRRPYTRPPWAA